MAYGALTAFLDKDNTAPDGVILTAVTPGGCPLDCPPCLIKARHERSEDPAYSPEHLTALAAALKERGDLGGIGVVGDEPLQDKSWPYTEALLRAANAHDVPSAVVTNGYYLPDFAARLRAIDTGRTKIWVSLDAHGGAHDILRRSEGAFARADHGLRDLLDSAPAGFRSRVYIATILLPGNKEEILKLVRYASEIGVPRIAISPLLKAPRSRPMAADGKALEGLDDFLPRLFAEAETHGIGVHISDEFKALAAGWKDAVELIKGSGIALTAPRNHPRLIRIDAAGRVETFNSVRGGEGTGITLPAAIPDIDRWVDTKLMPVIDAGPKGDAAEDASTPPSRERLRGHSQPPARDAVPRIA